MNVYEVYSRIIGMIGWYKNNESQMNPDFQLLNKKP